MASPSRNARLLAAGLGFIEIVQRGHGHLLTRNPVTGKYRIDTQSGEIGWHYGTDWANEVDTAWEVDTGAWQYKMVKAEYNAHARDILNVGDIINYSHPVTGENVTFQPLGLNWVDNATDSRQQLALPQAVTATTNDDRLIWANGYGTGRHFTWQTQVMRLMKILTIDAPTNIPAPTVSNPYLELEFIVKYSSGLTIWIDGQEWNKRTKTTTANNIEFRDSLGNTLWYFKAPRAWDSAAQENEAIGLMQVERRGAIQYVTVRWPKAWIDAATFPIHLDVTVEPEVDASANDAIQSDVGGETLNGYGNPTIASTGADCKYMGFRWAVNVPAGSTIDVAYLSAYVTGATAVDVDIDLQDADDAAAFVDHGVNDITGRTLTGHTATSTFTASGWGYNSYASIVAAVQHVVNRGGWAANQHIVLTLTGRSVSSSSVAHFDSGWGTYGILHIEYTAGSGVTKTVTDDGSGTDIKPTLAASLSTLESSGSLEQTSLTASLTTRETGFGVDINSLAVALGLIDRSVGDDLYINLSALETLRENGYGNDLLSSLVSSLGVSESGRGNDLLNLLASLSLSDAGTGVDTISVLAQFLKLVTDAGLGIDIISELLASLTLREIVTIVETASELASLSLSDSSGGIESVSLLAVLFVVDIGTGTESISVTVTAIISGTTVWGHQTGVTETNIRTFAGNWTGTGSTTGSGDAESLTLDTGQYMQSEVVNTGIIDIELLQNAYGGGSCDTVTLKYRTGASQAACEASSWITYSSSFTSLGYVQLRVEF